MKDLTYDYLHGTNIYLYQRKDMFRMNTDTALLAAFMTVKKGERLLDIGTNNGALLLAAARFQPAYMVGIDIQEEAIELARYNVSHHHLKNVDLHCGDVCHTALEKVDVIVCNPPYFEVGDHSNVNVSKTLQMARHETYLKLEDLCMRMSSLLDEKGRCYLVHRANRVAQIIEELRKHRLEVRTLQFVYDEHKEEAVSVLIEAIKDGKAHCHVLKPQILKR